MWIELRCPHCHHLLKNTPLAGDVVSEFMCHRCGEEVNQFQVLGDMLAWLGTMDVALVLEYEKAYRSDQSGRAEVDIFGEENE